jgi:AcrR family transcriptional regulator
VAQKRRTRAALLQAARELLARGGNPSIAEIADHADISRATAYRYFSTPEAITQEALLDAIAADIGRVAPEGTAAADPAAEIDALLLRVLDMVRRHESLFRSYISSVVRDGPSNATRGARRLVWIAAALEPIRERLTPAAWRRLVHGLSLVMGVETVIVLKDVCALPQEEMEDVARWTARVLIEAALREAS